MRNVFAGAFLGLDVFGWSAGVAIHFSMLFCWSIATILLHSAFLYVLSDSFLMWAKWVVGRIFRRRFMGGFDDCRGVAEFFKGAVFAEVCQGFVLVGFGYGLEA